MRCEVASSASAPKVMVPRQRPRRPRRCCRACGIPLSFSPCCWLLRRPFRALLVDARPSSPARRRPSRRRRAIRLDSHWKTPSATSANIDAAKSTAGIERALDVGAAGLEDHHQRLERGGDDDDGDELGQRAARLHRRAQLLAADDLLLGDELRGLDDREADDDQPDALERRRATSPWQQRRRTISQAAQPSSTQRQEHRGKPVARPEDRALRDSAVELAASST